jgi:peroxin-6
MLRTSRSTDVFIIGATNRPDLLDPALLRPGRLDRLIYLGVSRDTQHQKKVIQALIKKFPLDASFDLDDVLKDINPNYTGADLYALCSDAMLHAIKRCVTRMNAGETSTSATVPLVTNADFTVAMASLSPSVSAEELERYDQIAREYVSSV